ncbi:MAG: hypothetical protein AAB614_00430 [Patescibacteria group bacterium]
MEKYKCEKCGSESTNTPGKCCGGKCCGGKCCGGKCCGGKCCGGSCRVKIKAVNSKMEEIEHNLTSA